MQIPNLDEKCYAAMQWYTHHIHITYKIIPLVSVSFELSSHV